MSSPPKHLCLSVVFIGYEECLQPFTAWLMFSDLPLSSVACNFPAKPAVLLKCNPHCSLSPNLCGSKSYLSFKAQLKCHLLHKTSLSFLLEGMFPHLNPQGILSVSLLATYHFPNLYQNNVCTSPIFPLGWASFICCDRVACSLSFCALETATHLQCCFLVT